jgi:hypothetical protein
VCQYRIPMPQVNLAVEPPGQESILFSTRTDRGDASRVANFDLLCIGPVEGPREQPMALCGPNWQGPVPDVSATPRRTTIRECVRWSLLL